MLISEYNTEVEFCGEIYPAEVSYEYYDNYPVIYGVSILKQTCKSGQLWYGNDGSLQLGPHWYRLNITDLLSSQQIGMFAKEIAEFRNQIYAESIAEKAVERSIEQYLQFRSTGEYHINGPMNYTGEAVM